MLTVHAADLPLAQRRDAWLDAVVTTHLDWSFDGRDGTLAPDAAVVRHDLGPVRLVDCVAGSGSGARTARRIAATDGEWVGVLVVRDGVEHLEVGDERVVARRGDVVVWDSRVPTRFRIPHRLVKRTLLVPRSRLPGLAERAGRGLARAVVPRTPATALLVDYLDTLSRTAGGLSPAQAHAAGAAAADLLGAALAPATDPAEAGWHAVVEHVEARLGDPALGPRDLAAAHALSLRALYLLFERHGETVGGYVRRRRLERAHADLLRAGGRTTVAAVAARWGFADAGTFARAYRRAFGVPPSRTAASARGPVSRSGAS